MALAALAFEAGEYSTLDWLKLRRQLADEQRAVRELERQLDSLERLTHALEADPVAQERAAREQFGMIRRGETLYRLVPRVEAASGHRPPRWAAALLQGRPIPTDTRTASSVSLRATPPTSASSTR